MIDREDHTLIIIVVSPICTEVEFVIGMVRLINVLVESRPRLHCRDREHQTNYNRLIGRYSIYNTTRIPHHHHR